MANMSWSQESHPIGFPEDRFETVVQSHTGPSPYPLLHFHIYAHIEGCTNQIAQSVSGWSQHSKCALIRRRLYSGLSGMCESIRRVEETMQNFNSFIFLKTLVHPLHFPPVVLTLQSQTYSQKWYHFVTKVVCQKKACMYK